MKLRNINRIIPYCSIVGLGMLGLVIINPMCSSNTPLDNNSNKAYAAENTNTGSSISLTINGWTSSNGSNSNITDSITTTELSTAYISHNVSVSVSNAASYSLQLTAASGKTSNLVHTDGKTTITGANGIVGKNLSDNTWGYSWGATAADVTGLTYYTLPAYGTTGTSISTGRLEAASPNGSASFTKKLTFAAKFGSDVPDGSYTTEAILTLVVSPTEQVKTISSITNMQDITTQICTDTAVGATATLKDSRDGSTYTIAKIKNQTNTTAHCWMTQNLRIVNKTISSTDSDVTTSFTVPASPSSPDFASSNQYQPRAYYDNTQPTYGAYYNWYTATAGTGTYSTINSNASSSICPKGWRLPTSKYSSEEFYDLLNGLYISNIIKAPYNFAYGGYGRSGDLKGTGSSGYYWSSTADASDLTNTLQFSSTNTNPLYYSVSRDLGYSVRCVAK